MKIWFKGIEYDTEKQKNPDKTIDIGISGMIGISNNFSMTGNPNIGFNTPQIQPTAQQIYDGLYKNFGLFRRLFMPKILSPLYTSEYEENRLLTKLRIELKKLNFLL